MRVNRTLLYWGIFLAATGGVVVLAQLNASAESFVADALRLWPLAIIAVGVAVVLRRTRLSLAGGMIAAAVPGLALGGALAVGPHIAFDCGRGDPSSFATRDGALDGSARVEVTAGCGALSVATAPGSAWQLVAGSTAGRSPRVTASATSLSIDAGDRGGWHGFGGGRDVWRLTLPTTSIDDLSLVLNAGEGTVDLPGAQLGRLSVTSNAAQTSLNLSQASIAGLAGTVNAGWLSFELPSAGDIDGSFVVNAGALNICAPDGLGVRVQRTGIANSVKYRGLEQGGGEWQSPDYASAAHRADLTVSANFGSVDINPTGGCK